MFDDVACSLLKPSLKDDRKRIWSYLHIHICMLRGMTDRYKNTDQHCEKSQSQLRLAGELVILF